jgi:hypothetical protein
MIPELVIWFGFVFVVGFILGVLQAVWMHYV